MKLAILCIAIVVASGVHAAHAQPADPEKVAHAHFKQGKAYLDAGVYDEAIKELEAGYKLVPQPEFQFNIGQAYRLAGNKVAAKQAYQKYVELAPETDLADQARVFIATLTKQISDEAKAESNAKQQRAAADEIATHRLAETRTTQQATVSALQKAHDDARDAQRGRRSTGKWLASGGTVVVIGSVVVIATGGGDGAIVGSITGGLGVACLVYGILKIHANPDLGAYVTPIASGDAKGLAVGWSF